MSTAVKYPDLVIDDVSPAALSSKVNKIIDVNFSGEEVFGKYLDLNEQHILYCSLSFVEKAVKEDYLTYLDKFLDFSAVNEKFKEKKRKLLCVPAVPTRIFGRYLARVQPLVDTAKMIREWEREFGDLWSKGLIEGWTLSGDSPGPNDGDIDLDSFDSVQDLVLVGGIGFELC